MQKNYRSTKVLEGILLDLNQHLARLAWLIQKYILYIHTYIYIYTYTHTYIRKMHMSEKDWKSDLRYISCLAKYYFSWNCRIWRILCWDSDQFLIKFTSVLKFRSKYTFALNLKRPTMLYEDVKVICKVKCSLLNKMLFFD